ncbi:MAG: hypothetical protein AAFY41_04280 [Bacteroidota bacterium]
MKSLILLTTLATALIIPGVADSSSRENSELDMQLENDLVFQKMVRIYNYEGSLIREFPLDDVVNDKISILDHMIMEESDFAFDHLGDYYYLGDSENIEAAIN